MRCLYCNKKLSLLKLAKGDSFCSPEHFDAHQLQLSKDAINRLMNVAVEENAKPRLIFKPKDKTEEEPTVEIKPDEAVAIQARLNGFAPVQAAKVPPYAPFALARIPFNPLDSGSVTENEATGPIDTPRELAFPVLGVQTTICILNLYLRLSLAGAEPKSWISARDIIFPPEDFRLDLIRPLLTLEAAFPPPADEVTPEIEAAAPQELEPVPETLPVIIPIEPEPALPKLVDELTPEFEAPAPEVVASEPETEIPCLADEQTAEIEAAVPEVIASEPETALYSRGSLSDPVESTFQSRDHRERSVPEFFHTEEPETAIPTLAEEQTTEIEAAVPEVIASEPETAPCSRGSLSDPVESTLQSRDHRERSVPEFFHTEEPETAIPNLADEQTTEIKAAPEVTASEPQEIETAPEILPVIAVETVSVQLPEVFEPAVPRIPFLISPSFLERAGSPILLSTQAGAIPAPTDITPILDHRMPPRLDSCDAIPNSLRFAPNTSLGARNSARKPVESTREFPAQTAFLRPASNQHVCEKAWQPVARLIMVTLPALETPYPHIPSVGSEMPVALAVRPEATKLRQVDPEQLLAACAPVKTESLFLNVLETRFVGQDPLFADRPADAIEGVWAPVLAAFPDPQPLPAAWQDRTAFFPLPDTIVAWSPWPALPLEPLQYSSHCRKIDGIEIAKLPAPFDATDRRHPLTWPQADSPRESISADRAAAFASSIKLPSASDLPTRNVKTPPLPPSLPWIAHAPAVKATPLVKTLPVRNGFILPAARNWPRLNPLPR